MGGLERFFGSSRAGVSIETLPGSRGSSRTIELNPDTKPEQITPPPETAKTSSKGKGSAKTKGAAKP